MAAGLMGYWHARVVAQAVTDAGLDQAAIAAVDARVASQIKGQSWAAFRRTLRRAVLAANPDVVLAEHREAVRHRPVDKFDLLDAVMSELQVTMSAIDAQTVWLGLDATAHQLQAAARAAGLWMRGSTPTEPTRWSRGPTTRWPIRTHPAGTGGAAGPVHHRPARLLGLADNPAELLGYGPIPAALVRDRAATRTGVRLVCRPGHRPTYSTTAP